MARVGILAVISILLNFFLTFWLVNQYMSDVYFQNYVNGAIGQYYAFIVLTVGVGGGSGMGYLFLRKRHSDNSLIGRIQKSKTFKPASPMAAPSNSPPGPKFTMPTGAPPSPASRHTVYAVPPLPKSTSPSSSRTVPGMAWATAAKPSLEPTQTPKPEVPSRPTSSILQPPRPETPRPSSSIFSPTVQAPQPSPLRSMGETPPRPSHSWPQPAGEKRQEGGPMFQKPGMETSPKQDTSFQGASSQPPGLPSSPVPSKWAPPLGEKIGTAQWPESGVRSIPPLPSKWTPPQGSTIPSERPPQGLQGPSPLPGQMPPRGPFSPPQGGPRPFVIQGPGRPGEPRPIAAPRPFRPDPNRPPPGMGFQPRPPQPTTRPAAPFAGPMPQPWTPTPNQAEKKEPSSPGEPQATLGKQTIDQKSAGTSEGGGEMDWDTALDTILKTLRKDRVGDSK